jgi:ABC-type transport system substrate-binding protein
VDKNNVERGGRTWTDNPNGTGPYRLKEYARSQRIVLVKNDLYYGDPKPKIDEVQYILGGGSFMTMYENGDLDATAVSLADIERVSDTSNPLNKELYVGPYLSTGFVVFNVRKSPFDDANVRQAFAMAINRRQLVDVVFKKMPLVAQGILPPAMPGYTADVQGVAYDPDKAKQLLAASKYAGKLPEITWYTVGAGGAAAQDVQAMTQMLKTNLGVEVSIQQTDWATFIGQLNGRDNPYQMFDIGWVADYADPQNFVEVLFRTGSLQNWSGYSNPDLDKLLDQAGVSKDSAERFKLYQQAQQMILKDVPVLPLTYSREYWLTKSYVKADPANALYPPMIIPRLKYLSIVK